MSHVCGRCMAVLIYLSGWKHTEPEKSESELPEKGNIWGGLSAFKFLCLQ